MYRCTCLKNYLRTCLLTYLLLPNHLVYRRVHLHPVLVCTYSYIHTYIHTYLPTYLHTYRQTEYACIHASMHAFIHTDKQTDRQIDRDTQRETQTDGQTDGRTDRTNGHTNRDRRTDRDAHMHTCRYAFSALLTLIPLLCIYLLGTSEYKPVFLKYKEAINIGPAVRRCLQFMAVSMCLNDLLRHM